MKAVGRKVHGTIRKGFDSSINKLEILQIRELPEFLRHSVDFRKSPLFDCYHSVGIVGGDNVHDLGQNFIGHVFQVIEADDLEIGVVLVLAETLQDSA